MKLNSITTHGPKDWNWTSNLRILIAVLLSLSYFRMAGQAGLAPAYRTLTVCFITIMIPTN